MQPSQQSASFVLADAQPNIVVWYGGIPTFWIHPIGLMSKYADS